MLKRRANNSASAAASTGRRGLFVAFRNPGFTFLWSHVLASSMARMGELAVLGWLVLQLTDSPLWLGVVTAARGVGSSTLAPLGGALADRLDRRWLLIWAYVVIGLIALILGILIAADVIQLWHLVVAALVQGVAMSVNFPARQSLTYDLVGRDNLFNAMSANFMAMHAARIVGPITVGFIMATVGAGVAYFVVAASALVAIFVLLLIRSPRRKLIDRAPLWDSLIAGIRFAISSSSLRLLLSTDLMVSIFLYGYMFMLPVFARDILKVGPLGFGFLMSAPGVGAIVTGLFLSSLGDFRRKGVLLVIAIGGYGLFLAFFSASTWFFLSLILLLVVGGVTIIYDTTASTLVQMFAREELRGRIVGLQFLAWSSTSLGGLWMGALGSLIGVPIAVGMGGIIAAM